MKCMCHFNVIYFLHKTHNQTLFKECEKYFQAILYHMSMACVHLPAQSTIFLLKVKDYAFNLKFNQGPDKDFGCQRKWILTHQHCTNVYLMINPDFHQPYLL